MNRHWILAAALAGACASPRSPSPAPAAARIVAMLQASADEWNRGDLDGFLGTYADSATFVTPGGLLHGLPAIRARYRAGYWKTGGPPPQLLRFDELAVRRLGRDFALATGRYILTDRATGQPAGSGHFSLVLQRTAAGWRIIHDHSSG